MRSLFHKTIGFCLLGFAVVSCHDKGDPNYQYMPDMYEPVGYEAYGEYEVFENGQEAKLPVEGSVPRGWLPYDYENNPQGYQAAKANLNNPIPYTEENLAEGKALYTIYCAVCHGDKGAGKGILVEREKILGVPSYDDAGRAITEGSVYHVMYYGINNMGSYASQTTIKERWQIDHYVMNLKNKLEGKPEREFEEESEVQTSLLPSRADANLYDDADDVESEQANENNQTETQE
ncbi:quinol:cytochrome c oxidoreductase monoheme cytochrome subunit [Christiangramia gaetbulicola]|uniref:Quinol:cytochrome c oxidoreductase monoheme cytochrome subunit n=1 Tax=Christiangramia gaetbulicola TaxID=703340 RepID=A0A2T6AKY9_9FLAO|nr:cytochrome c [Christiangramia gaetbulicola]PTX44457.1 quinol:cytochrome c oxidoreductase monoheme cytochrome subunit [Christiangramia gaetbulicola]